MYQYSFSVEQQKMTKKRICASLVTAQRSRSQRTLEAFGFVRARACATTSHDEDSNDDATETTAADAEALLNAWWQEGFDVVAHAHTYTPTFAADTAPLLQPTETRNNNANMQQLPSSYWDAVEQAF